MQKTLMTQEQQLFQEGIFSMSTRIYTSRDLVKATGESLGISFRGSNWCTQEESDDRQAVLLGFPCFARSVLFHLGSLFVVPDLQMSDPFLIQIFCSSKFGARDFFRTKSNLSFVKQNRPELFKGQGQQVQEITRALRWLLQAWQVSLAFAAARRLLRSFHLASSPWERT